MLGEQARHAKWDDLIENGVFVPFEFEDE